MIARVERNFGEQHELRQRLARVNDDDPLDRKARLKLAHTRARKTSQSPYAA